MVIACQKFAKWLPAPHWAQVQPTAWNKHSLYKNIDYLINSKQLPDVVPVYQKFAKNYGFQYHVSIAPTNNVE